MTTLGLIAVTCLVTLLAWQNEKLLQALILWPPAIKRKNEYYRLITCGFLHANGQHLLFNMVTLFFFGLNVERLYHRHLGPFGFLFFYLLGLLVSAFPSYWWNRDNYDYRSLGASGAVSAVLFAFILVQPWAIILIFFVPLPAVVYAVGYIIYTVMMNRRGGGNINHSAHLWGAVYGVVFTISMEPRLLNLFFARLLEPRFAL